MAAHKKPAHGKPNSKQTQATDDRVAEALERLRAAGLRITTQREDVLQFLAGGGGRHSVQDVYQEVRRKHPSISLDTVYRTLGTLAKLGVVSQVNLQSGDLRYEFQGGEHHHHHAVCLNCGNSICLEGCPLPESFFKNLEKQQFRVTNHAFEVYGFCADCGA